jgi:hypothetical protein
MASKKTKAEKHIDKQIEAVYREHCSGVQINMLDIPKVFDEGRKAIAEGRDLKTAIVDFVKTIQC